MKLYKQKLAAIKTKTHGACACAISSVANPIFIFIPWLLKKKKTEKTQKN